MTMESCKTGPRPLNHAACNQNLHPGWGEATDEPTRSINPRRRNGDRGEGNAKQISLLSPALRKNFLWQLDRVRLTVNADCSPREIRWGCRLPAGENQKQNTCAL